MVFYGFCIQASPSPSIPSTPILKGKGKALPTKRLSSARKAKIAQESDDDDELVEDASELEYDEGGESSGDEGSVFKGSEEEEEEPAQHEGSGSDDIPLVTPRSKKASVTFGSTRGKKTRATSEALDDDSDEFEDAMAVDDEEEAKMLRRALKKSLETEPIMKAGSSGAGEASSSRKRAGATQKRLKSVDSFDLDFDASLTESEAALTDEEGSGSSSEGGGFVKPKKKKGNAKADKVPQKPKRKLTEQEKATLNAIQKLERAEVKKVGRKLTWVSKIYQWLVSPCLIPP